jgi:hypothetical protein
MREKKIVKYRFNCGSTMVEPTMPEPVIEGSNLATAWQEGKMAEKKSFI